VKVKLADGKERTIQHMMMTTFWHPDGTPMSAQQFMEMLFGKLPDFFQGRGRTPRLWSALHPRSCWKAWRRKVSARSTGEMQKIIDAENSDLFDVLAHVAYALPPLTREERAWQRPRWRSAPTSTASSRCFSTSCSPITSAWAWRNWIKPS
jgi:type I restriction enzyme R subunit